MLQTKAFCMVMKKCIALIIKVQGMNIVFSIYRIVGVKEYRNIEI